GREGAGAWESRSNGFGPDRRRCFRCEGHVDWLGENHRISDSCVRFTCSFMRSDLSRRGRILPLYTESLQRLAAAGIAECTLVTPLEYAEMAEFLKRRCVDAVTFFGETRGSAKALVTVEET